MKNAEYWRKRMELLMEAEMMEAEEFEKEVFRAYSEAIRSMQQDIELWYARFAKNNQVSLAEARKMLRKRELEELRWTLEEYIRHGQENGISADWTKQLENASARVHISRLESLQIQCCEHVHEVTGGLSKGLEALLAGIYTDGFYRTIFEYQKAEGDSDPFARLNADRVDRILKNPWSRDGTEFSERIWRERDKLVRELHTGLTQSMIRGDPLEKMIKQVMERFDVSRANASRIVRTESAAFAVLSQRDALRALGVKEYEVCGTLDGKTCTICGEMDKKVFPLSLFETGVTAPVFHPNCRCCISPNVKEEIPGKRAARGPDGKTYYVPSDMNYSEWKKKYVDNDPAAKAGFLKQKNESTDRLQFSKYQQTLGKDAPKTLDEFQVLKYTDKDTFRFTRLDYNRRRRLNKDSGLKLPNAESATAANAKFEKYLFNPENKDGYAKGEAFTSRLGYDAANWRKLQREIRSRAPKYPVRYISENEFGKKYEQKIIVYGLKGKPANVVVGWYVKDSDTWMTSCYIKEVK